MLSSTTRIICTPALSISCSRFILSSISLMMERSSSVLPNQQNTYSNADRSSSFMRRVIPWLKGVSTTIGVCGCSSLMVRAIWKTSLFSAAGIQMMRSIFPLAICISASCRLATCMKRGGKRSPRRAYSENIFSSTRPSSSSIKAS